MAYIESNGKPVFDAEGRFLGYRGVSSDVTAAVCADQAEAALHRAQTALAHVTRVMTLGELTASIAHEINQPLAAIVTNGNACVRWLAGDPPNLEEVRQAVGRISETAIVPATSSSGFVPSCGTRRRRRTGSTSTP